MGALKRNNLGANKIKENNQRAVVKKEKQKKQQKNKTSLKSINKRENLKVESKIGKATRTLAKELRKGGNNNVKHVSADLLNSNVAKPVRRLTAQNHAKTKKAVQNKSKGTIQRSNTNLKKQQKDKHLQAQNVKKSQTKTGTAVVTRQKQVQLNESNRFRQVKNMKDNETEKQSQSKVKKIKSRRKKKDNTENKEHSTSGNMQSKIENSQKGTLMPRLNIKRLEQILAVKQMDLRSNKARVKPVVPLRDRMMAKLRASRFRYINETLYNNESSSSKKYFKDDPDAFTAYHNGYKQQIEQWPLNPLDEIISSIKKMPKDYVVADFGCGEGRLATSVAQKVHSFDFVSLNDKVTACDMAHTPLLTGGVNIVVFCLSLMGTNLNDYIIEANRVLKKDGILKIAEVESRFEKVEDFIKSLSDYGFKNTWKDLSHNLFYFLDFKKEKDITKKKNKLPPITLKACLYKKR